MDCLTSKDHMKNQKLFGCISKVTKDLLDMNCNGG